jgi:hypothetical protein
MRPDPIDARHGWRHEELDGEQLAAALCEDIEMTFGELPVGAWFRTTSSPVAKIKTGFNRWKWAHHEGFLPVSNGANPDLEVTRIFPAPSTKGGCGD